MTFKSNFLMLIAITTLAGCKTTAQYTSGTDYLARYQASSDISGATETDTAIRQIAAVEPDLKFPARIGLARIKHGALIGVPTDEAQSWAEAANNLGPEFGEFIPVSPLVASMISKQKFRNNADVIDHIRKGAARQHLDYVIAYEVADTAASNGNALRVADLTILGLFVLSSRNIKAEATASAILLNVRNGYPYLTGSTFADKTSISAVIGKADRKEKLRDKARQVAVGDIAEEFATGLKALKLTANRIEQDKLRTQNSLSN